MPSFQIHINGRVQGVGFRPFVYQLAKKYHLSGWVSNGMDGVSIAVGGEEKPVAEFYLEIVNSPPRLAIISSHQITPYNKILSKGFHIAESQNKGPVTLNITPDFGLCEDCRKELNNQSNRRYQYSFTTCTNCGPRYSIINKLPYDRPLTTMDRFEMCLECAKEYHNPDDRRYFSQTNSCSSCGIQMELINNRGQIVSTAQSEVLQTTIESIQKGKIVAIKGIGGYLILAHACLAEPLKELRKRKHRPTKPFALLYPDLKTLKKDVIINRAQSMVWESSESPIIILQKKKNPETGIRTDLIAPGLDQIGAMAPYAPLLALISQGIGSPVVATSGNISGSPIIYNDKTAREYLTSIADYILIHNRPIITPQDDSVIKFSNKRHKKIIIRRSRGLAPSFAEKSSKYFNIPLLAMGAMMKSTIALFHETNIYISQYLGDLDNYESQQSYLHTFDHLQQLFSFTPRQIIVDKHPQYFSTQYGKVLAEKHQVPIMEVQHHEAHFAAVLGENNLLKNVKPVLGIIWDGTGYGHDGHIWGGEFMLYQNRQVKRIGSLPAYPHILGDKMAREPRISALSLCCKLAGYETVLKPRFSTTEWSLYHKILNKTAMLTTSAGRLFDAVACLLNITDRTSYEGEAAMWLENIAYSFYYPNSKNPGSYLNNTLTIRDNPVAKILRGIINDVVSGLDSNHIAARFHWSMAHYIHLFSDHVQTDCLAFSGGVFQNSLLIDMIYEQMDSKKELYFHKDLSPNDESISYGQLVMARLRNQWPEGQEAVERSKKHYITVN